jgi:NAD(P)-dependent dehydrogenase (short-subunit alcohol dehydrogenase family)
MKSDAGRAVILSSSAAHKCRPFWGPYSASKAAVEALARTWAAETQRTALRVTSVDPRRHPHRHARAGRARRGPDDSAASLRTWPRPSCRSPLPR